MIKEMFIHKQAVLPSDNIADSPEEAYKFNVPSLNPGPHQITVRAADAKGNRAFQSVSITVETPTAKPRSQFRNTQVMPPTGYRTR